MQIAAAAARKISIQLGFCRYGLPDSLAGLETSFDVGGKILSAM
jgi:hypothetical protein